MVSCTWWTGSTIAKNSVQLLDRVLDCEYPKEKYVFTGAQKRRILTPDQHKNRRKSSLNGRKPLQNPQISLTHTYVLHHMPRFIQKASVGIIYDRNRVPTLSSGDSTRMMRFWWFWLNLWFKSELRYFWCTLYFDLWCRSLRSNYWLFIFESAPEHKFGPILMIT